MFFRRKEDPSLPYSVTVCGYKIKRMPLGAFLTALQRLEALPQDVFDICMDGCNLFDVIRNLDMKQVERIAGRLISAAPEYALEILSDITQIPYDKLINDVEIGASGIVKILQAVWEVNRLGEFTSGAYSLWRAMKRAVGSMEL